jgi:cellobiose phosphorylase
MSTVVRPTPDLGAPQPSPAAASRYGYFAADGTEFRITDPRTPRPWVNLVANPRFGLAVSQTGSGFSWVDNSQLAVITRWEQDLAQDRSGKFLYVRDVDSGEVWSLSPAPVWPAFEQFECQHGLGYTTFRTTCFGIAARWTLFCHARDTVEFWRVELHNLTDRPRRLELTAFLEWCCGVAPSPRREFHKLFIETEFAADRRAIFARNHMWEVPSRQYGHWNVSFPYTSALACTEPIAAAQGDKAAFLGRYGEYGSPAAISQDQWKPQFGRHEDAIAALRSVIELRPGQRKPLGYALAVGSSRAEVEQTLDQSLHVDEMDRALEEVRAGWQGRLAAHRIDTPEPTLNFLTNDWVRYQAIAGRLWGRAGYYQQSGAYGFRDQLQDSQVWLTIDPARCRQQLNLHAAHQFADGSVYHWWHPLSEQGHITRMTDDLLWLAFVTANYIKETGNLDVLNDATPFLDDAQPQPLREHVRRAFARVFGRISPRGLPYIGAGDWNDGLSAVGLQERGESVWLGQFLAGLLADWAEIYRRTGAADLAADCVQRRDKLIVAINAHGWDGKWYICATRDDGEVLGSHKNRVCRVYLNTQVWAILNDIAPPNRAAQCMQAVRDHLVSPAGALLLAPAFDEPIEQVGYITRYAPGLRENGGVYTHAATWAIAAAAKAGDAELVGNLLTAINPALKDPERYWAEPYVLPGNVDGPDSPHHGRAGWTWYTGSAQWLHRVVTQYVLGVRTEWDGLHVQPCLPPAWTRAEMVRPYRGSTYHLVIERAAAGAKPGVEVALDGVRLSGNVIAPPAQAGGRHEVHVRVA